MIELHRKKVAEMLNITLQELNEIKKQNEPMHDWIVCGATLQHHGYTPGQVLFSASHRFKPELGEVISENIQKDKRIEELEELLLEVGCRVGDLNSGKGK